MDNELGGEPTMDPARSGYRGTPTARSRVTRDFEILWGGEAGIWDMVDSGLSRKTRGMVRRAFAHCTLRTRIARACHRANGLHGPIGPNT